MKYEELIKSWDNFEYHSSCECGKIHTVLTQQDRSPEYYTNVFIKCDCGEYVLFDLPVN